MDGRGAASTVLFKKKIIENQEKDRTNPELW